MYMTLCHTFLCVTNTTQDSLYKLLDMGRISFSAFADTQEIYNYQNLVFQFAKTV